MQQARTHRVGVSFDVQSGRYTGKRISAAARGELSIEDVFYLRPIGKYHDRKGHRFHYDEKQRMADLEILRTLAELYRRKVDEDGFAEEHARGLIPYALRQDFVVSFNARSLMHFLDLRAKADAQLEIRQLCDLLFPFFGEWMPEVAEWYCIHRLKKARLSP
jgi:thymidylate synthase (FAD)